MSESYSVGETSEVVLTDEQKENNKRILNQIASQERLLKFECISMQKRYEPKYRQLSRSDKKKIRRLSEKFTQNELAKMFNVSQTTISKVLK